MFAKLSYLDRIKLLMLAMMTTGHFAWAFVPTDTLLGQAMHFFARSTVMLACFLVVEGFRLTHDLTGYLRRLFGFGLIAQIPYIMMMVGVWRIYYDPMILLMMINVLITLGLGLFSLVLCKKAETGNWLNKLTAIVVISIIMVLAYIFNLDWGYGVILWTIAIYYKRVWGFIGVTAIVFVFSLLFENSVADYLFLGGAMSYGIILAIPIMVWYEKNKHKSPKTYRLPRTFFYWYYVIHTFIIGLLVQFTPYATDEYGLILEKDGQFRTVVILE